MKRLLNFIALISAIQIMFFGCQRNKDTFDGGYIEVKPESDKFRSITTFKEKPIPPIFSAKYNATLKPVKKKIINLVNCTGEIQLDIIEDMGQKMSGILDCGFLKKDLSGMNQTLKKIKTDFASHTNSQYLTRKSNTENVIFTPPRIYMLTPLIQDPNFFVPDENDPSKNFYYKEDSTLRAMTPNGPIESTGYFEVAVHGKETYQSDFYSEDIDVLVYSVNTGGFENLDPNIELPGGSIYRSMKFWYSSRPIVIPRIEIILTLNEIPGEKDAKFTNWLTGLIGNGELLLTLDMIDYKQLTESSGEF